MMKTLNKTETISIGLAMFAMFFGAGNVIFPLALGQYAGDKNFFAIVGLILTAALMPAAGVFAMILFEGNYRNFFGRLGNIPGFILALTTISLLGPLGSTPRCIALAYTTLKSSFLDLSVPLFSALACVVIFLFTIKKKRILALLGWVLTPILLLALLTIIVMGFFTASEIKIVEQSNASLFLYGLKEGYNTMDLLASFFFSSAILNMLRLKSKDQTEQPYLKTALWASVIGTFLLALVYICFSYLASFHGNQLSLHAKDELLAAISHKIAGPYGGLLVCVTIAMACLTTAIALISAFADFVQKEIFQEKVSYEVTLVGSLIITYIVSTYEFTGISAFLGPVLQICYPGLIVLTAVNISHKLYKFEPVKLPVFVTFAFSTLLYFIVHFI
jgi:branched-chain amino acid:cation transporter, LIVCS family